MIFSASLPLSLLLFLYNSSPSFFLQMLLGLIRIRFYDFSLGPCVCMQCSVSLSLSLCLSVSVSLSLCFFFCPCKGVWWRMEESLEWQMCEAPTCSPAITRSNNLCGAAHPAAHAMPIDSTDALPISVSGPSKPIATTPLQSYDPIYNHSCQLCCFKDPSQLSRMTMTKRYRYGEGASTHIQGRRNTDGGGTQTKADMATQRHIQYMHTCIHVHMCL